MWKAINYARNTSSTKTCRLLFRNGKENPLMSDPVEKAVLLRESFFPSFPRPQLDDIINYNYLLPHITPVIMPKEIKQAVMKLAFNKAPGNHGIPNKILKQLLRIISSTLYDIFNASFTLGYCPKHFRDSITIALWKPDKDDYSLVKSYRPIALLNTIGKVLESILASRISYLTETFHLLPYTHIRGQKSVFIKHVIYYLVERIYSAWNSNKIPSALFLDVTGAFNNVSHPRLLHNLRKRKIDDFS